MSWLNDTVKTKMPGLENMRKRIDWIGGSTSDGRNVKGKLNSFHSALNNSYQAEWITIDKYIGSIKQYRCLINPDKLKNDYDQKEISIDFDAGLQNGDTFFWARTNSHWIAYLQRYEEEAYFRAQIRRCDYSIDINGKEYWIYVRGPVETALIWRQKHQIEFNELNYSILFYITKDENTLDYFSRLKVLKFDGHNWRVAATDKYSQDGLIEVYLKEYFDNSMEEDIVIPEEIKQDPKKPYIDGPQFVKPFDENVSYSIVNKTDGEFVVSSSKVKITNMDKNSCTLEILTGKSTQFDLIYRVEGETDIILPITVKSL